MSGEYKNVRLVFNEQETPKIKTNLNTLSLHDALPIFNVTMGYSLKSTPIAGLMEYIFDLQRNIRFEKGEAQFYFRSVLPILTHRYISLFDSETTESVVMKIKKENLVYVPAHIVAVNPLLERIFKPLTQVAEASRYLMDILEYLQGAIAEEQEEEESDVVQLTEREKEFIDNYYLTINQIGRAHV